MLLMVAVITFVIGSNKKKKGGDKTVKAVMSFKERYNFIFKNYKKK